MSSTKATGLASPTMPIKSENPALRTFQKSSLAASTNRVRTPSTPGWPSNFPASSPVRSTSSDCELGVELRSQDGRRLAFGEIEISGVKRIFGRQVEDHPIEHFDGHRAGFDDLAQPVERRGDRRKREHDQSLGSRQRNELQHGGRRDRERPLRAHDQLGQIESPGLVMPAHRPNRQSGYELVEVVAAHPCAGSGEIVHG